MQTLDRPSPNFGDRPAGATIDLVVLHYTAMEHVEDALERLCDPASEVSSHYLIDRDGVLFRLVAEDKRAWHAGAGAWAGLDDVNSRSIGIELDNDGLSEFDDALLSTLEVLLADLMQRHNLPAKAVIGHSDMAPDRKQDPGRRFPWARLAKKGLAVWPEPSVGTCFIEDAATFGYPVEAGEAAVLEAFRQRFRPDATGPLSAPDASLMAGLARQFPHHRG